MDDPITVIDQRAHPDEIGDELVLSQRQDAREAGLGYPHVRVRAGLSSQGERGWMASRSDEDEGSQEGGENERGERPPHAPTLLEILVLIHAGLAGDGAVGLDRAHELERRV